MKGRKTKDLRVPVAIGVDQRSLVPAPEVKGHHHSDKHQEMVRGTEAAGGRKELMKSLEDEDKEKLLLEKRDEDGSHQMRKTSHSKTTERRRDSTGERRKSGHR